MNTISRGQAKILSEGTSSIGLSLEEQNAR
jgi:hypothetical protein